MGGMYRVSVASLVPKVSTENLEHVALSMSSAPDAIENGLSFQSVAEQR